MAQLQFNSNLSGKAYKGINDYASIADNSLIVYDSGTSNKGRYAYLTGYYYVEDDVTYLQTTINNVWLVNVGSTPDWQYDPNVKPKTYSQLKAQYLVNKICKNNDLILRNNLVCARYANIFTKEQQQQIRSLQERLQLRNEALQAKGLLRNVEKATPEGYAELAPYLDKLMSGGGVGVATWAVIVVAAVVVAGLGTAAYFAYKSFADESEKDVKFSKELTAILAQKLTPEEYQQLLDETKGIVTKARIKQAASSYGTVFMIAGAAVGGFLLYRFLKEYM